VSADRRALRPWAVVVPLMILAVGCGPRERGVAPPADRAPGATPVSQGGGASPTVNVTGSASAPADRAPPTPVADGKVREITFDDLKLPLEKGEPYTAAILPPAVAALEGQRVRIRGYILPSFQQKGITQFVLVRDNMECCFGPGALLHDCVVVRMRPGKSADFSIRPVAVAGSFRIEELKGPDGKHLAIYGIDGEAVE
jgi:hypothetical protein